MKNTIFSLLVAFSILSITHGCTLSTHWAIEITNGIPANTIIAYVKSGDTDLGAQIIQPDTAYAFNFCERIDGRTLFYADFIWGTLKKRINVFDKYTYSGCYEDGHSGEGRCYWLVRNDGFVGN